MPMRLLVTRPAPGCRATAARLEQLGIEPVIMPLLTYQATGARLPDAANFAAIALTSADAVRALRDDTQFEIFKTLPVFAVGAATAGSAEIAGFTQIKTAEGGVGALADLILGQQLSGPVLYPAARHRAGDLELLLHRGGQDAETIEVYEMRAAPPGAAALADMRLDASLFYSRRTAEIFRQAVPDDNAAPYLCLSDAVAKIFRDQGRGPVRVAEKPSEAAMMALVTAQRDLLSAGPDRTS